MDITTFEEKIQKEINPHLNIKWIPTSGVNGVHYDDVPIYITLPPGKLLKERSDFYFDPATGTPWRGVKEALRDIKDRYQKVVDNMKYEHSLN